jgi:hypothetical protein
MSLLQNASGVLPLAVQHLPQTQSTASADETSAESRPRTPSRLRQFVLAAAVFGLVTTIMVALIAAISVSS